MGETNQSFDRNKLENVIRLLGFYVDDLDISVDELVQLAGEDSVSVLESAASNAAAPENLLRALSKTGDAGLRRRVAANPSTPDDVLMSLADDADWRVRREVACNPAASNAVLGKLVDRDELLLDELAAQIGISPKTLVKYSEGTIWLLLEALAWNPSTPKDVLRVLAEHGFDRGDSPVWDHRREYERHLELAEEEGDKETADRLRAALDPSTPKDVLKVLASDGEPLIRQAVAFNPAAPDQIFALFASGGDAERRCVAESPYAPTDILGNLAVEGIAVLDAVHGNPTITFELIGPLGAGEKDPVLQAVAKNPSTSEDILRRLAKVDDWSVRYLVAYHPSAPEDILLDLANDADPRVREGVADAAANARA